MNRLFATLFCFAAAYLDEIKAALRPIIITARREYFSRPYRRRAKAERRCLRRSPLRGRPATARTAKDIITPPDSNNTAPGGGIRKKIRKRGA
ncbi:MAG: hypothetical protein LBK66_14890 [Spirochaetaceae bacterium]|nr:hypothetical protein [Spirochaetaceae bacterium]